MNKLLLAVFFSASCAPLMAQQTNQPPRGIRPPRPEAGGERRLEFLQHSLDRLGVTEEERSRILTLQEEHREAMRANIERIDAARTRLSRLQEASAPEEEIDVAISEVSVAQGEQLRILVRNRMEMERILGREKHGRFMESARREFQKKGRRGESFLPPRPALPPPVPGDDWQPPRKPLENDKPPTRPAPEGPPV